MELQNIKKQKYDELINQLDEFFAYYEKESNLNKIAKMSSLSSALKLKFNTLKFVGFYTVEKKLIKNSQNETNKDSLDICKTILLKHSFFSFSITSFTLLFCEFCILLLWDSIFGNSFFFKLFNSFKVIFSCKIELIIFSLIILFLLVLL